MTPAEITHMQQGNEHRAAKPEEIIIRRNSDGCII